MELPRFVQYRMTTGDPRWKERYAADDLKLQQFERACIAAALQKAMGGHAPVAEDMKMHETSNAPNGR